MTDVEQPEALARSMAVIAYDTAKGVQSLAEIDLRDRTQRGTKLRALLSDLAFESFWREQITDVARKNRDRIAREAAANETWAPHAGLGKGIAAKRINAGSLYEYQYPFLGKFLGEATVGEFRVAHAKIRARLDTDRRLDAFGTALELRLAGARDTTKIKSLITENNLRPLLAKLVESSD